MYLHSCTLSQPGNKSIVSVLDLLRAARKFVEKLSCPFVFVMLVQAPSTCTAMQIPRTCHLDSLFCYKLLGICSLSCMIYLGTVDHQVLHSFSEAQHWNLQTPKARRTPVRYIALITLRSYNFEPTWYQLHSSVME